ncbi:MAG: 4-hydroxy-3-methylbut-2-enyl diphosphate reductase [bacterium]
MKQAQHAGFCYGVQRAVDLSIKIKKDNLDVPVYILGQLIHNDQVIEELNSLGIQTIEEIPEKIDGICIIRTHGVTPQMIQAIESKGCKIVDATCPDVKRVQDKAKDLAKDGYRVIIIGKADHPEVVAIKAHSDLCSNEPAIIISSKQEAENFLPEIKKTGKIGVVIQTTQLIENFKEILPVIVEYSKELKVYNTICLATFKRQQSAKILAKEVELMVVVGSKSSANTTHLAEIIKPINKTILIETSAELENYKSAIDKAQKIGVTAGASTPEYVINEVIKRIGESNQCQK